MMTLSERFKLAMRESGIKAPQLIKATGASKAAVYWWIDGTTQELSGDYLLKAARALKVRPEWLGEEKGPMRESTETIATPTPDIKDQPATYEASSKAIEIVLAAYPIEIRQQMRALLEHGKHLTSSQLGDLVNRAEDAKHKNEEVIAQVVPRMRDSA